MNCGALRVHFFSYLSTKIFNNPFELLFVLCALSYFFLLLCITERSSFLFIFFYFKFFKKNTYGLQRSYSRVLHDNIGELLTEHKFVQHITIEYVLIRHMQLNIKGDSNRLISLYTHPRYLMTICSVTIQNFRTSSTNTLWIITQM